MPLYEKIGYYKTILTKDYAKYVDKIEAKELVPAMTGGTVACTRLIRILKHPDDIQESDLNPNHMIKSAHGCGWNISIDDTTTVQMIKERLHSWNHCYKGENEIQYTFLQPRFFLEEKLVDAALGRTAHARVYLIRCIHGSPFVIGVRTEEGQNSYDLHWNPIKKIEVPNLEKPEHLDRLLEAARQLSKPFEFVRIDLYLGKDDRLYFSEFTFTPSGGNMFYSMKQEKEFGKLWK
jgi:hypothetical protein